MNNMRHFVRQTTRDLGRKTRCTDSAPSLSGCPILVFPEVRRMNSIDGYGVDRWSSSGPERRMNTTHPMMLSSMPRIGYVELTSSPLALTGRGQEWEFC